MVGGTFWFSTGAIEKIDGNGSSVELITDLRAKQGTSDFRMYATQCFSDVLDVHRDKTASWLS